MSLRSASWPLLCVALVTLGCAKGDTGPTGPRGPTGSANVIYSDWYSPPTWTLETEFGVANRTCTVVAPSLTQEIVDQGVVMVYMRLIGWSPSIIQLPFLIPDLGYQLYFRARADSIKVVYFVAASPTSTPVLIATGNQIRYVLIPGGEVAAAMQAEGATYEQEVARLRSMPYPAVCRRYGVPE
jgi:hypothetical protein